MKEIPFVSAESAQKAREFEQRFQELDPGVGVIFVSVEALPAPKGLCKEFKILLGITKKLHSSVGWAIIRHWMREEIQSGEITITGGVFTGVSGACRDESAKGANPSPAPTNEPV